MSMGPPLTTGRTNTNANSKRVVLIREVCPMCEDGGDLDEDMITGDCVCLSCGEVVGSRLVDRHSEYRTFANDKGENPKDMTRVGSASDDLLSDASNLSTRIASIPGQMGPGLLAQTHNRATLERGERKLLDAFHDIISMCDRVDLPQAISQRAKHLYKQTEGHKLIRGRKRESVIAACVYIACRQEKVPRSFKEICAITTATKQDIGKSYKNMLKILEMSLDTVKVSDLLPRFISTLQLPTSIQKVAAHVADSAVSIGVMGGRSPVSIAAAAIFMATYLSANRKTLKDIGDVVGVAEGTIRLAYKDMIPHKNKLYSEAYRNTHNLDELPSA